MLSRILPAALCAALLAGCARPAPPPRPEPALETERQLMDGNRALARDDLAAAARFFSQALAAAASLDDPAGIVAARLNLAQTAFAAGNLSAVQAQLADARHTLDREGARADLEPLRPRFALLSAGLALRLGELGQARTLLTPLLPQGEGCPAPQALAALADRTCLALTEQADAGVWMERLRRTLAGCSAEALGAQERAILAGRLARFEALAARRSGDLPAAHAAYARALEHYRAAPYRPGLAATLTEWGALFLAQGDRADARERLERALAVRVRLYDRAASLRLYDHLAALYDADGDQARADALREWRAALEAQGDAGWQQLWERRGSGPEGLRLPYR